MPCNCVRLHKNDALGVYNASKTSYRKNALPAAKLVNDTYGSVQFHGNQILDVF